jgi:TPP-dependent 2-oxoacid decarboxylase
MIPETLEEELKQTLQLAGVEGYRRREEILKGIENYKLVALSAQTRKPVYQRLAMLELDARRFQTELAMAKEAKKVSEHSNRIALLSVVVAVASLLFSMGGLTILADRLFHRERVLPKPHHEVSVFQAPILMPSVESGFQTQLRY